MNTFQVVVTIASPLLLLCQMTVAQAGTDTSINAGTATSQTGNSNSETTLSVPTSTNPSTPFTQQTGVIQFNNSGLSALTYPNCGGACVFAIGRMAPSYNGTTSLEAVAGVVWQFKSPENTQAQAIKRQVDAQNERLEQESTVTLSEKLAEAIEQGRTKRANLLAILLAKRLGYPDYQSLLRDVTAK